MLRLAYRKPVSAKVMDMVLTIAIAIVVAHLVVEIPSRGA
jgi:hypothetical protein